MKKQQFKWELFFIAISIIATLGLQIYWNLKNFQETKNRIINEVQIALDLSVEQYFATISKQNIITVVRSNNSFNNKEHVTSTQILDSIIKKQKYQHKTNNIKVQIKSLQATKLNLSSVNNIKSVQVYKNKKSADTATDLKAFSDRLLISMREDSIIFKVFSSYLKTELIRKNIAIEYSLEHIKNNRVFDGFNQNKSKNLKLETFSKSTYLSENEKLKMNFSDPTRMILERIRLTIILSILFSFTIISCLFYLLKIINTQKKIDVVKNDLISNITHEFKTPITTMSSAIEAIRLFNPLNDTEKTNRYLDISKMQLLKLETMVEKILETASLQTDELQLQKSQVSVDVFVEKVVNKFRDANNEKNWKVHILNCEIMLKIDVFHVENALSNLIDNAIKYGGSHIVISIEIIEKKVQISVADSGKPIDKSIQKNIFDQFFRGQKNNIHNVKGFGIGLYYARQIIEMHGGTLIHVVKSKNTVFKISLPHEG